MVLNFTFAPHFTHEPTIVALVLSCQINVSLGIVSSFNDKPVNEAAVGPIGKELFEKEQENLLSDLKDIPKKACDRRVSSVVFASASVLFHKWDL